ncbi:hypothetical protein IGI37_002052 [Enterococcus sp. AZ194]|uniref:hypothetical protein n=1 Tax=Enterococcus sp. AZ194 TaxID=2774629 RepID=UPI003F295FCD
MTFHKLADLFEETHLTAILEPSERLDEDLTYFIEYVFQTVDSPFGLLHLEWLPVPYLSITDNLLLGSSLKKKEAKSQLVETLALVNLDAEVITKSLDELSSLEGLKLQLAHNLLLQKRAILVGNVFPTLSVQQIQEFLPLLRQLAKRTQLAIVVLTPDESIANSPYMDEFICPVDSL